MTVLSIDVEEPPKTVTTKGWAHSLLRRPAALASASVLAIIIMAGITAPILAPYSPLTQDATHILQSPTPEHWLGTDTLGRDVLSRLMFGARVTLQGTLAAVVVFTLIGSSVGILAAASKPKVEAAIMRFCDLMQSIPGLIIMLVVLASFGNSETAAMFTLGIIASQGLVRVVRAVAISVRESGYVAAARVAGLDNFQIQTRHILPAITGPALTQITLFAAIALIVEASLGYLGLGTPPPDPSWGNMISDAQTAISRNSWMLIPTGGMVVITALSLGLLGNAIRDSYAGRSSRDRKEFSWRNLAAKVAHRPTTLPHHFPPAGALLDVRNLTIQLPGRDGSVTIVDGVTFSLRAGEALGIVGESGCGKSMTVAGILRVLPPGAEVMAETLTLNGRDLLNLSEAQMTQVRGSEVAYISQEPVSSLDPSFTVGAQLVEAIRVHRPMPRRQAQEEAVRLLDQVRMPHPEEVLKKYPHELSGGMAQRVAIARALAGQPKLLIADEPTTALDVTVQAEILDLLRELRETTGMALILVTHDWGVLADSCDRTVVMYAGQTVEEAPLRDLIWEPRHPYSRALMDANPEAAQSGQPLPTIPGSVPPPGSWPKGCHFANRCPLAADACSEASIPLITMAEAHLSRCIRTSALQMEKVAL